MLLIRLKTASNLWRDYRTHACSDTVIITVPLVSVTGCLTLLEDTQIIWRLQLIWFFSVYHILSCSSGSNFLSLYIWLYALYAFVYSCKLCIFIVTFMYSYFYVYVFLLLCMFCSVYFHCVVLCIVCVWCVLYYCHWVSTQLQLTNISSHIIIITFVNYYLYYEHNFNIEMFVP